MQTAEQHRLLNAERETRILALVGDAHARTVAELARELGVSAATVRRDLQSLHERKLLQRVRGGATHAPMTLVEPLFQDKEDLNAEAKQRIAQQAFELVHDHDLIYLDGGSTILMLARLLERRRDLTVVTNSLMAAAALMTTPHRLILVGGEFRGLSRTVVGPLTSSVIQSLRVDKAFMGTIGFTVADGMMTTDPAEAFTKEQVMGRANRVILLADGSKLGVPSLARSGRAEDIDVLITDAIADTMRRDLELLGIEVLLASSANVNGE